MDILQARASATAEDELDDEDDDISSEKVC